ncbi:MAG: hypothetical protein IJ228_02190 [Succinivibrio sp.]|nr:hypothetical protein [Succinivibrio sp.]
MPFLDVKVTLKLNAEQQDQLQSALTQASGKALGKPSAYVMVGIQDGYSLFMNAKRLEQGAMVAVSLWGTPTRAQCDSLTAEICAALEGLGILGDKIYVSFTPVDNWGYNGRLF